MRIEEPSNVVERNSVTQQVQKTWSQPLPSPEIGRMPLLETKSWIFRHPGILLSIFVGLLAVGQWASIQYMANSPAQKKTNSSIRGIRKDMRIMQVYILESGRSNRHLLGQLAKANNLKYEEPRELVDAEKAVRKLLVK